MAATARDSTSILAAKVAVTGTTLSIAGGMVTTSMQYLPALITAAQKAPTRADIKRSGSGRLTPQPDETKTLTADDTFDGYRGAAQQLVTMSKAAFSTQVPPELASILASSYLAYHSYSKGLSNTGHKWVAVAALVASIFPLTGGFMAPLDHRLARLGGLEEMVEPMEDAPPDRDAERLNAVAFLGRWNTLNKLRSVIMLAAGGIGLWGLVE